MQAAEKHGETRNQDCKRIKHRDYSQDGKPRHTNQCTGNKLENRGRDDVEKHEQPVFLTASAAREAGIFLCETVNEVVHVSFVLFVLSGTMPDGLILYQILSSRGLRRRELPLRKCLWACGRRPQSPCTSCRASRIPRHQRMRPRDRRVCASRAASRSAGRHSA